MWWLDPRDEATFTIHDQFALGNDLIVAPVVERGATTRDIYLTQGCWRDPFAEVTPVAAACSACADAAQQTAVLLSPPLHTATAMTKATGQHRLQSLNGQMLPLSMQRLQMLSGMWWHAGIGSDMGGPRLAAELPCAPEQAALL